MKLSDFDYELPPELIAQEPASGRDRSEMMIVDPEASSGPCPVVPFFHLPDFLEPGDAVVFNNTKVIPARLFARKDTGAMIEILLLSQLQEPGVWHAYVRNAKRLAEGASLCVLDGETPTSSRVVLRKKYPDGSCEIAMAPDESDFIIGHFGHLPLPPYIRRPDTPADAERYQTVYARTPGAVAAPTAGLHFTQDVLSALDRKGVRSAILTLHVGAGTFKPVETEEIEDHRMHAETYTFPAETAELLNSVRRSGGRILAVGTTSLRTLESCVRPDGFFEGGSGETDIYIYPPRKIRSADMLLTNFHLPKSTLLMLVSAFAGMETIRSAYRQAVQRKMRFFSYGDCMLIKKHI